MEQTRFLRERLWCEHALRSLFDMQIQCSGRRGREGGISVQPGIIESGGAIGTPRGPH